MGFYKLYYVLLTYTGYEESLRQILQADTASTLNRKGKQYVYDSKIKGRVAEKLESVHAMWR